MKALLLSGGMDSIALAYWLRPSICVTIDYGQLPAEAEIAAATAVCTELGLVHRVVRVDCRALGSGDMIGKPPSAHAPVTEWWPFRNQLLLTVAAAALVEEPVTELIIGCLAADGKHADGTREFIEAISALMRIQEKGLVVLAPAIDFSAIELIQRSQVPWSLLAWAHSCHISNYACGECRGCSKHLNARDKLDAIEA